MNTYNTKTSVVIEKKSFLIIDVEHIKGFYTTKKTIDVFLLIYLVNYCDYKELQYDCTEWLFIIVHYRTKFCKQIHNILPRILLNCIIILRTLLLLNPLQNSNVLD